MSIVRGLDGYIANAVGNLVPTGDYSIYTLIKSPDISQYDGFASYANTASSYFGIGVQAGAVVGISAQQFTTTIIGSAAPSNGVWYGAVLCSAAANNVPELTTATGTEISGGGVGAYTAPASQSVHVFRRPNASRPAVDGSKVGCIVLWNEKLSAEARDDIMGGANPASASSAPVEAWFDNVGVITDGSGNLVSWTGINGTVLTPSGVVTVDDADIAPHGYVAGSTDSIDSINGGSAVTDGQTSIPFTYTGFATESINSILLDTAGNSVPALNVVDSRDGTGAFDMPSIAGIISDAGTDVVNFGVISTRFGGVQSDTPSLTVAVAAGYEEVVLAGLETTDTNYLYQVMLEDRTLANGESVYYATAAGTIAADGQISMVGDSMNIIVITAGRVAKPYTLLIASIGSGTTKTFDISIGISI